MNQYPNESVSLNRMSPVRLLNQLHPFFLFWLAALFLRWPGFFPSVIDHDESTYIVIADALRNGKLYYVDVIDNKPIGIFLLFALLQKLLGSSIFMIRFATATWIAATAFLLHLSHRRFNNSKEAGLASGLIYIFITSIFTFFGVSPNTELFFNLFTVAGFMLLLPAPKALSTLLAGLLMGAGFLIKYVVVFDAIAFSVLILILHWKKGFWFISKTGFLLLTGFCLPFGLLCLYYYNQGHLQRLFYFTFELSYKYVSHRHTGSFFLFVADMLARFLPVSLWFFLSLLPVSIAGKNFKLTGAVWSAFTLFSVIIPGKLFYHYFIQFMPPYAWTAGQFFNPDQKHGRFWSWLLRWKTGGALLGLLALVNVCIQYKDLMLKPDRPREVANWLKQHMDADDQLYAGNYHQIVYHLLDKESPTPYVHRSLLTAGSNLYALGTEHNTEMKKILQQEPDFIIVEKTYQVPNSILNQELAADYKLVKVFEGDIKIYEREESN